MDCPVELSRNGCHLQFSIAATGGHSHPPHRRPARISSYASRPSSRTKRNSLELLTQNTHPQKCLAHRISPRYTLFDRVAFDRIAFAVLRASFLPRAGNIAPWTRRRHPRQAARHPCRRPRASPPGGPESFMATMRARATASGRRNLLQTLQRAASIMCVAMVRPDRTFSATKPSDVRSRFRPKDALDRRTHRRTHRG